jgi:gas vesicle protein
VSRNNHDEDDDDGLLSLLAGLGVGIILGGLVALVLAPQAGQQTRAQIRESADDAMHRLHRSMDELRVKVENLASRAGKKGAEPALEE